MREFEKVGIIKNVSSSWLGLGVNIAVGIFISPFILHKLGDDAFGLWVLIFSLTGYYGLFDFGIRSSIVRYVARFRATRDEQDLNQLINTSLFSYSCVGLGLLILTVVGSWYIDSIFHIPPSFVITARLLFLMVGASLALGFPVGVFGGILEGVQKFYWLNLTNIAATLLRALLIVIFLNLGYGLLTVAFISVILPLIAAVVRAGIVFRIMPLRFGWSFVSKASLRQVVNYGSVTFMIMLAGKLRFKTDALVIGTFLTAAAITYFSIGARLVDYVTELVDSLAQIFTPMSSHFDATGDMDRLRAIFIGGNRACALVIFPLCAGFVILGKSIIEIWVGTKYIAASYPVLLILLIPSTLRCAQSSSSRILFGMARHRWLAVVTLIEGLANLLLSVLLVRPFGIIGDALGTAIPLTFTCLFFLPQHLCHLLGVRIMTFLRQAYLWPLILCLPLVSVLLLMQHWFVPHTLLQLLVQVLIAGVVYGAGAYWLLFVRGSLTWRSFSAKDAAEETEATMVTYQEES